MVASTQVMGKMNAQMNPQKVNKQMMNFARQNEKFEMTQEMMNDAMDDAFAVDSGEEDAVVNQVLDEIGIEINDQMVRLNPTPNKLPASRNVNKEDQDIQNQLNQLGINF